MRDLEAQLRAYGSVLDRGEAGVADVVDAMSRRMRRPYFVAIAAVVVVAIAASAITVAVRRSGDARPPHIVTPGPTQPTPTPTSTPVASGVLAVGDSVMEGATVSLEAATPGIKIDAVKSRQFFQAIPLLSEHSASGAEYGTVVIALGTKARRPRDYSTS